MARDVGLDGSHAEHTDTKNRVQDRDSPVGGDRGFFFTCSSILAQSHFLVLFLNS